MPKPARLAEVLEERHPDQVRSARRSRRLQAEFEKAVEQRFGRRWLEEGGHLTLEAATKRGNALRAAGAEVRVVSFEWPGKVGYGVRFRAAGEQKAIDSGRE